MFSIFRYRHMNNLRIILSNLFATLILFPGICLFDYWDNIFKGNYKYLDAYDETLGQYLNRLIIHNMTYPLFPFYFFLVVLLPFQLLTCRFSNSTSFKTLLKKIAVFHAVLLTAICFTGTFVNVWKYNSYENLLYVVYLLPVSIVFTFFFWTTIDRYETKKNIKTFNAL